MELEEAAQREQWQEFLLVSSIGQISGETLRGLWGSQESARAHLLSIYTQLKLDILDRVSSQATQKHEIQPQAQPLLYHICGRVQM